MASVVISEGGQHWIGDERRKQDELRIQKLHIFALECEGQLNWLQEYYQKALTQQLVKINRADLLKTSTIGKNNQNLTPIYNDTTVSFVKDNLVQSISSIKKNQQGETTSKEQHPPMCNTTAYLAVDLSSSQAISNESFISFKHIVKDAAQNEEISKVISEEATNFEASFFSTNAEFTEASLNEDCQKKDVCKGKKASERKRAPTKKKTSRTRAVTNVPYENSLDEPKHEVSEVLNDIAGTQTLLLPENDPEINKTKILGAAMSDVLIMNLPKIPSVQENGLVNESFTSAAPISPHTISKLPKSLIPGSRTLSTSFAVGKFQIAKPKVKSAISELISSRDPCDITMSGEGVELQMPSFQKCLAGFEEMSRVTLQSDMKRRRSSQDEERQDKFPAMPIDVGQNLLSIDENLKDDDTNLPPYNIPLTQFDETMRQEKRLKSLFTSGSEKIKRALSSLRPVASSAINASVLIPQEPIATFTKDLIVNTIEDRDAVETIVPEQIHGDATASTMISNFHIGDSIEQISSGEVEPAAQASVNSGDLLTNNDINASTLSQESLQMQHLDHSKEDPAPQNEAEPRRRSVIELVQEIERRQSANSSSRSASLSRRSSCSQHSDISRLSMSTELEVFENRSPRNVITRNNEQIFAPKINATIEHNDIAELYRPEPELQVSDLQALESDLDAVLKAVNENSVNIVGYNIELHSKSDLTQSTGITKADSEDTTKTLSLSTSSSASQVKGIWMKSSSTRAKPEVKALQLAAAAAKKEEMEKVRKAARAKEVERARHLAMQRRQEEEQKRLNELRRKGEEKARRMEARAKDQENSKKNRLEKLDHKKGIKIDTIRTKTATSKENLFDKQTTKRTRPNDDEVVAKTSVLPVKNIDECHMRDSKKPKIEDHEMKNESREILTEIGPADHIRDVALQTCISKSGSASQPLTDGLEIAPYRPFTQMIPPSVKLQQELHPAPPKLPPPPPQPQYGQMHTDQPYELPEIDSDYSSEGEEAYNPKPPIPDWANSPALRSALLRQSTWNPEAIFGAVHPVQMDDIFKGREKKFRPRSSSANWSGTDRLTIQEEIEYKHTMGFKN